MTFETPSNKHQIDGSSPPPIIAINCTDPKVEMIVDKLVITTNGYTEDKKKQIWGAALLLVGAGLGAQVKLKNGYAFSVRVFIPSSIEPIYISLSPKHPKSAFFRVEFNPAKLGAEAIAELVQGWIVPLLGGDLGDFWERAKVSRIDIAIDLIGVEISQLLVFSDYAVSSLKYDYKGKLETLYLGKSKSPNQTRIYDKIAEMIAKGLIVESDQPITRIERVVRNAGYLKNLTNKKNPFKTLHIGWYGVKPDGIEAYLWEFICCYAQHHTPQAALAKLPKSQRAKVKAALKANEPTWWNTVEIWKQWPTLIDHLGLIPKGPLHYAKAG